PHRDLHSFPTRRSSDLATAIYAGMIGWNGIVLPQAIAGSNGLTLALAGWLGAELVDHGGLIFVWQWVSIALLMLWTNAAPNTMRSEEHTSELQSRENLV